MRHVVVFLACALIGAVGVRLLAPSPAPAAPSEQAPSPSPTSAPSAPPIVVREDCGREAPLVERIVALEAELAEAELAVTVASAQEEAEVGAAQAWPVDVDPAFAEAGIEGSLQGILDEVGAGELIGLDCGEYPCVGIVTFPGGGGAFDDRTAMNELLAASPYDGLKYSSETLHMSDEGEIVGLTVHLAFPAAELDDGPRKRTMFRMSDAMLTFGDDVKALLDRE